MTRSHHYLKAFFASNLLFIFLQGWGQEPYQLAKVIPPSPTAASLGTYGDFQIGYYNGLPQISIPVYDIKTNNNALNIQLQYDASGTRMANNGSWVGLGWSLSAGGVITRVTRGLDDFLPNSVFTGYYNGGALPPNTDDNGYLVNANSNTSDLDFFGGVKGGSKDGEPDVFCYNFANYSGKFVLGKSIDGSMSYTADRNNLKVQYINGGWILTNSYGYKYYFNTKEVEDNYSFSSTAMEIADNAPLSSFILSPDDPYITSAWYLDSIVSPTHEAISFVYSIGQSLSLVSKSETLYTLLSIDGGCTGSGSSTPSFPGTYKQYYDSRQLIHDVVLKKITFRNGSVNFATSDREDIDYADVNHKPAKLSTITINDANSQAIKQFSFYYSYFGIAFPRLKLDSIAESGSDGSRKPPYAFNYYNPDDLPAKDTKAVDHWGYYNGQTDNQTLLPSQTLTTPVQRYLDGGNRDPDTTNLYPRNGVLSSITYPTGGYSNFDYELNDYSNLSADEQYVLQPTNVFVMAGISDQLDHTVSFDLTETTTVNVLFNFDDGCSCTNGLWGYSYATLLKDGQAYASYTNSAGNTQDAVNVVLGPGHYGLYVTYVNGFITTMSASWNIKIPVVQKKGGGLRIKAIRSSDGVGNTTVKKFDYTNQGKSTGRLMDKPKYDFYFTDAETDYLEDPGGSFQCNYSGLYSIRTSNSIFPFGLSGGGSHVAYDKVTEIEGENGENGRTEHYFYNGDGWYDGDALPGIPIHVSPLNGKVASEITYNAAGTMLARKDYSYSINETYSLKGLKLFSAPFISGNNFFIKYYDNPSNWVVPLSERDVVYSNTDSLVTTKTYYYTNTDNKELKRSELVKSDGRTLITKYKYPDDYSSAGSSSFAAQMVSAHMISPVVEQQTLVRDASSTKLLSGRFTAYSQFNGSFYKPSTVYKLSLAGPSADTTESSISGSSQISFHTAYEPDVYFDQYDAAGDLSLLHKASGAQEAYIWDYTSTLPVIHAINASSQDVAYTSFEADGSGNWTIGAGTLSTSGGITGKNYYTLSSGAAISKSGLSAAKNYFVTYWAKNGPLTISGTTAVSGLVKRGWTFYQHTLPAGSTSVSVTGAGVALDELRLYPVDAQMSTLTYTPLIGESAACAVNNLITYYEYDGLGRLLRIRDIDSNIVKQYEYQYQAPAVYFNTAKSGTYARACSTGGTGSTVTYTVAAGTYRSGISQADADAKAQNDITTNGQNYANTNGTCTFYNTSTPSGTYTRACSPGGTGSTVTYTVAAGTYASTISQADANQQATNAVTANGQNYANAHGTCTFYNVAESGTYTCACGTGGTGSAVTYTVAAGTYSSTVDQTTANQLALNDVTANGQSYANAHGTCTYYNTAQSGTYARSNCGCVYTGSSVTYTVAANTYSSSVSQAAANQLATNDVTTNGPNYANANGTCTTTCTGPSKKIINCACQLGTLYIVSQTQTGSGTSLKCITQYGYSFSDGSYLLGNRTTTNGQCPQQ